MPFIYITRAVPDAATNLLAGALPDARIEVNPEDRNLNREELIQAAAGCDALICTLADPVDASFIEDLGPRLKVIATYAVGYNNIDLEAARNRNIPVCNTPDVLTDATAEIAVGLILACARRFIEGDRLTRQGGFTGWAPLLHRGHGVYGKTVGIVGAGRIGKHVAATLKHGFDCEILYHSRADHVDWENDLGAKLVELGELLERSDFVSLHCPLTPDTRHLIDADMLKRMKPTAILVNTARGPVVDEAALVAALTNKRIAGAGFDVYENEPALTPGLGELDNTVLLPHIGSATFETRDEMGRMCARAVIAVLTGKEPENRVV
ncbi:MAG: D-glycerate dehydrogenase [Planctomycetes bacterium]|nr:D-glycerate dehydrogenase [Planctomycetota bacterium]